MERASIRLAGLGVIAGVGFAASGSAAQEFGQVVGEQKIAAGTGGFSGALDNRDQFGEALAVVGDVDGDGIADLAVGVPEDDDGGSQRGALWILFLTSAGAVRAQTKISSTAGDFAGVLDDGDRFGCAVALWSDFDGDGRAEVAVAAEGDDDGGVSRGAVWVLSLAPDGRVSKAFKISQTSGGFTGTLRNGDAFGHSLAALGDLDGDGLRELAVGAPIDRDGGTGRGAVWILFPAHFGGLAGQSKISSLSGGFLGPLKSGDRFGKALASPGDLDGDGVPELAVGADQDDDAGSNRGAVWILFLRADATVRAHAKVSSLDGLALDDHDHLGWSLGAPGDLDGDGTNDLCAGAPFDDDGLADRGAAWIVFLAPDGNARGWRKISATEGGFAGPLAPAGSFGCALAGLGDLGGDDALELAVGTIGDDTGGQDRGAVWILSLESAVTEVLVIRNGLGVNPLLLAADDPPAVGSKWAVRVDCRGFKAGVVAHALANAPVDGPVLGSLGQVLIDWRPRSRLYLLARHHGRETTLHHVVPPDLALVGVPFYSQAFVTGRGGARLTNALDGEFVSGQ